MTPEEQAIFERGRRIRQMAGTIIGLSEILEDDTIRLDPVERIKLEAIVGGSALPLAREILALFDERKR